MTANAPFWPNMATWSTDLSGNTVLMGPDGEVYALSERLAQQHTDSAVSDATTDETILFTYTIPAGKIGPNDSLVVKLIWKFDNANTANRNRRIRLGGISGTQMQYDASGSGTLGFVDEVVIHARGVTNSQISTRVLGNSAPFGSQSAGAYATASRDMTVAQDLVVTGAWATSGDGTHNITLMSATVDLVRAAA